jgi:S-adenosylmethionine:tRNA ribosyltransferase-isomerase
MSAPPLDSLRSYHFELPSELVAQEPIARRDGSRLLVVRPGLLDDRRFSDLPDLLGPDDLLIVNDSRVMPARCWVRRASGGRVELLFLEPGPGPVEVMLRPGRRLKQGELLRGPGGEQVELLAVRSDGTWQVRTEPEPLAFMERLGSMPLPPYIHRAAGDGDIHRYQTVYAVPHGSAAAPTAGLHFSGELLQRLEAKGVRRASVTLHVGPGTFRPLRDRDLERGELHPERFSVPEATAQAIAETRARGGRVVAVGTTTVRALEAATPGGDRLPRAGSGTTRLFLREGDPVRVPDAIITNFHLPGSSLILLVAAVLGRERLLEVYGHAIARRYRFYSYGDAMLVLPPGR